MILDVPGEPLRVAEVASPEPGEGQVLLRVHCCAVCRTDLHVVDGELPDPRLPLIPGHQIVGIVEQMGEHTDGFAVGDRVGVPWLGWTDGGCRYCLSGRENLCENARFTGYQIDGGYAEYASADARFCFPIPEGYPDLQAAPLLCAGLIGHRSLRFAGDAERLGLYGLGASAHIVAQVAAHEGRRIFAFTSPHDEEAQEFARELGAEWAGSSEEAPPEELDPAIIFAPAGARAHQADDNRPRGRTTSCNVQVLSLPDYVQGAWFDAEGHGQSAPELTVELYGHLCAWGPRVNLRRGKRPHRAVEGPSRHDPGEDVRPQEVAHALDQDGLELAARKRAW